MTAESAGFELTFHDTVGARLERQFGADAVEHEAYHRGTRTWVDFLVTTGLETATGDPLRFAVEVDDQGTKPAMYDATGQARYYAAVHGPGTIPLVAIPKSAEYETPRRIQEANMAVILRL